MWGYREGRVARAAAASGWRAASGAPLNDASAPPRPAPRRPRLDICARAHPHRPRALVAARRPSLHAASFVPGHPKPRPAIRDSAPGVGEGTAQASGPCAYGPGLGRPGPQQRLVLLMARLPRDSAAAGLLFPSWPKAAPACRSPRPACEGKRHLLSPHDRRKAISRLA